jgi:hypothetical protein
VVVGGAIGVTTAPAAQTRLPHWGVGRRTCCRYLIVINTQQL